MPRGGKRSGAGRPAGVPNKATTESRTNFNVLLTNNLDRMQGWLDAVAEKDPLAALRVVTDWAEFSVPKLARTEVVGDADKPVATVVRHVYEAAK